MWKTKKNWNGPYLEDIAKDSWGNIFSYQYPAQLSRRTFDIISLGADNQEGGEELNADIIFKPKSEE